MTIPITTSKDDSDISQLYPDTLYYASLTTRIGHQPVFKKLLPDGEPAELSPEPSQEVYNHSPTGFHWGYGGSGPAQLALALLLDATADPNMALKFYQEFKWQRVAKFDRQWAIGRRYILAWIAEQQKKELEAGVNEQGFRGL